MFIGGGLYVIQKNKKQNQKKKTLDTSTQDKSGNLRGMTYMQVILIICTVCSTHLATILYILT